MKNIGIIGPNTKMCSQELYDFGIELGKQIASKDRSIICGGLGGLMEAVCKGAKQSSDTFHGQTIGILPNENAKDANPYIDIAIPTGLGIARNIIILRTSDILIALGGGAGTLSEIAFAWQLKKRVLCLTKYDGWAKELADKNLDNRQKDLLIAVNSIGEILEHLGYD
tara:strand:- start:10523 stop:11026 length:504 start_codon:yes stop_codon:yes gene_type:complete